MLENPMAEIGDVVAWITERVEGANCTGCVVGVSGGIDSAVTAALCKRACPSTTLGLLMPYAACDDDFTARGRELCETLEIPFIVHPIGKAHEALATTFFAELDIDPRDESLYLPLGNLRSRLRMCALYLWANRRNALVAGTGNRDEDFVLGYFTKYGDGGVDISPIADFHKSEVMQLARALDVPASIVEAPPSAGLWDGQTDEDELGMTYAEVEQAEEDLAPCSGGAADLEASLAERGIEGRRLQVALDVHWMRKKNAHKLTTPPVYQRKR